MSATSTPRRRPGFPGSLTDLHRFRKTAHGHDGSSRIVMVRKTDQRTYASIQNGQEPKLETITRETIETFRGQRTECKVTTEKKDCEEIIPPDLIGALNEINSRTPKKTALTPRSTPRRSLARKKSPMLEFQTECLKAHNEYRGKHGVPPLKLNRDMCKASEDWANYLIKRNRLEHSNHKQYGENLYCFTTTNPNPTVTGKEPVECWYGEISKHKFGQEVTSLESGHFTQVIWKDSRELGVAYAKSGGKVIVVANYDPPGNIIGQFASQVLPTLNSPTSNNNNNEDIGDRMQKLSVSHKPSSSSSCEKSNGTQGNFEEDFLTAHNEYRKRHGVSPLKLDKKLCKYSQEWANHLAAKNTLEHRPNSNYGENIYCLFSSDPNHTITGHTPVDSWYEEVHKHPFGKEPNSLKSGHFTQVVWKSSEFLGVGVAKNGHGRIFVVGNYSPAGNFVGNYVENVPPPLKPLDGPKDEVADVPVVNRVNGTDSTFNQFALDGLKAHNDYRRKHGVPEIKLSEELCDYAQEWASTCARSGSMCHRANNPYGENIFCVYSSDYSHVPSARDAVQEWYNEVKKHRFDVESVNHGTLHFTQVIWKDSKELGFAMARDSRGQTFVVANYKPRGNYIGQFVANVPRPKS